MAEDTQNQRDLTSPGEGVIDGQVHRPELVTPLPTSGWPTLYFAKCQKRVMPGPDEVKSQFASLTELECTVKAQRTTIEDLRSNFQSQCETLKKLEIQIQEMKKQADDGDSRDNTVARAN